MAINLGDALLSLGVDSSKLQSGLDSAGLRVNGIMNSISKNAANILGAGFIAAGTAITGALVAATSRAMEFQKGMSEIATLGVQDLDALGDSIKDVASRYGQDLTLSVKAAYNAISAGAKESEVPYILEEAAKAATAGVTDLNTAVKLGMQTMNAFSGSVTDVSQVYDAAFTAVKMGVTTFEELASSVGKLSPIWNAAGLSMDEMFVSIAALTKQGLSTSEAITGLKAAVTSIIKPTQDAEAAAHALGIEFDSTALSTKGFAGLLDDVVKKIKEHGESSVTSNEELKKMEKNFEANKKAMEVQVKSWQDELEVLKQRKEKLNENAGANLEAATSVLDLQSKINDLTDKIDTNKFSIKDMNDIVLDLREQYSGFNDLSDDTIFWLSQIFTSTEALGAVSAALSNDMTDMTNIQDEMNGKLGATNEAFDKYIENNPAHQLAILKSSFASLAVEVGEVFLPILLQLLEKINSGIQVIQNFRKEHPVLFEWIVKIVAVMGVLSIVLGTLLVAFGTLGFGLAGTKVLFGGLASSIGGVGGLGSTLMWLATNPITWVVIGFAALAASLGYVWYQYNRLKKVKELEKQTAIDGQKVTNKSIDILKEEGIQINEGALALLDKGKQQEVVTKIMEAAIDREENGLKKYGKEATKVYNDIMDKALESSVNATDYLQTYRGQSVETYEVIQQEMKDTVKESDNSAKRVRDGWATAFRGIEKDGMTLEKFFRNLGVNPDKLAEEIDMNNIQIPQNAKGTKFFGGGLSMVGENGPELISAPFGSKIYNNSETKNLMNNKININITGNNPNEIANAVANKLQNLQIQMGSI